MLKSDNEDEYEDIKVILIGEPGVGKTNLINTSMGKEFAEQEESTINPSYSVKKFTIEGKKYALNLWDTAGQERYLNVTKLFFKGSGIVILVYDITNLESFKALKNWYEISNNIIESAHIYAIVGNKSDLYMNSKVDEDEAKQFADSIKSKYQLVSAKKQRQLFIDLLEELIIEYRNKKLNMKNRRKSMKLKKEENKKHSGCCS